MTRTGKLGICSSPSRNIGSDAAATNEAGIITSHLLFGIKFSQSPLGVRIPHIDVFPPFVCAASVPMRRAIE
jgi:hypothetical protein